jgi:hypothetical protein
METRRLGNIRSRKKNRRHLSPSSWFTRTAKRFHEVSIALPRDQIVACVGCWQWDEKPTIFIKSGWLRRIYVRSNSIFGLIDAIGIREALNAGILTDARLQAVRSGLDALAESFPQASFISLADSVLLKSNWAAGFSKEPKYSYDPEIFIHLFRDIRILFQKELGLKIYGILTQGTNAYFDDRLLHISKSGNHICLNSLGTPFANLFEIDKAARRAIKDEQHSPRELYLDDSYFKSLTLAFEFQKHKLPRYAYFDVSTKLTASYVCTDCDTMLANLDPS